MHVSLDAHPYMISLDIFKLAEDVRHLHLAMTSSNGNKVVISTATLLRSTVSVIPGGSTKVLPRLIGFSRWSRSKSVV